MPVGEHTLTEFLQHSGRVIPEIAEGVVLLRRRDGDDLVLMTRGQNEALDTTLRVFVSLSAGGIEAISLVLPWFAFLSESGRQACLAELQVVAAAALDTGRLSSLAETLYAWEATGLAAWDEGRNRERAGWAEEEPIEIPRPEA